MKKLCLCLIMAFVGGYAPLRAQTFNATGGNQSYIVPGPGTLTITAKGADGASTVVAGGSGATVKADFPVLFGDELIIVAGKAGVGNLGGVGFGGGGGGSAVILTRNGTSTLLIVAGAGGGSSTTNRTGRGGSSADGNASGGSAPTVGLLRGGTGGGGFNVNGSSISAFGSVIFTGGQAGTLLGGGSGGTGPLGTSGGFGFGGGGSGNNTTLSGGGGGGYGGGNGGYGSIGATTVGGSGGTSFILTTGIVGTNLLRTSGTNGGGTSKDGNVILDFVCGVTAPVLATAPIQGDSRYTAGKTSANVCQSSGDVIFAANGCDGGTINWNGTDGSMGTGNIAASSAAVGTVTYSATCTIGICTSTASQVSVTVNALPTVTPGPNKSVVFTPTADSNCTMISAQGNGGSGTYTTYNWTSSNPNELPFTGQNPTVCPTVTTTYSVTVTDGNGCTSAPAQVTVTVKDVRCGPNNQNVQICYYGVNQCVTQSVAARYLKLGATLGACGSNVTRIAAEGAEANSAPLTLTVKAYPNPTASAMTVEVNSVMAGPAQLDVLDIAGRPVQQRVHELTEGLNEIKLNLSSQAQGTYLIRCRDGLGRQAVVRVLKQ